MEEIAAFDLMQKMKSNTLLIIDLRDAVSYKQDGLEKALSIPLDEHFLEKFSRFRKEHPEGKVYLICYRGNSSKRAVLELEKIGFEGLVNVTGGMQAIRDCF